MLTSIDPSASEPKGSRANGTRNRRTNEDGDTHKAQLEPDPLANGFNRT